MVGTEGKHFILDLWDAPKGVLNNYRFIRNTMLKAAEYAKIQVIQSNFHKFKPSGISGYVLIAESHISIHTWPNEGYASIDIYTCGNKAFPGEACKYLIAQFGAKEYELKQITRGISTTRRMQID